MMHKTTTHTILLALGFYLSSASLPLMATSPWQFFANGAQSWATAASGYADTAREAYLVAYDAWVDAGGPTSGPCYDAKERAELADIIARAAAEDAQDAANLAREDANRGDVIDKRLAELRLKQVHGTLTREEKMEMATLKEERKLRVALLFRHCGQAQTHGETAINEADAAVSARDDALSGC